MTGCAFVFVILLAALVLGIPLKLVILLLAGYALYQWFSKSGDGK